MITLEQAQQAKKELYPLVKNKEHFAGIGITKDNGDYAVKVNFSLETKDKIPQDIAGVKVMVEIVGQVTSCENRQNR